MSSKSRPIPTYCLFVAAVLPKAAPRIFAVVPALPNPPYAPGTASTFVTILARTAISSVLVENSNAGQGDITVPGTDDGSRDRYRIELDVSKPRNYTYKMTKI